MQPAADGAQTGSDQHGRGAAATERQVGTVLHLPFHVSGCSCKCDTITYTVYFQPHTPVSRRTPAVATGPSCSGTQPVSKSRGSSRSGASVCRPSRSTMARCGAVSTSLFLFLFTHVTIVELILVLLFPLGKAFVAVISFLCVSRFF